ncbi:RDD family protein [uncultured Acetobacterium sp.]|uniref:RDD family protein n=1 Tax=uncultured Acetobacterium sp. TaxID=217139 RepID=UPI0025F12DC5|nr:RDD family protein [uncultured Acetobacterium sp.]
MNQKKVYDFTTYEKQIKKDILIRRFAALFIDYIILCVYAGTLFLFSPMIGPLFQKSADQSQILGLILLVIPVFLYFSIFEASKLKATPGKMLFHVKVVKIDEATFSYKNSFFRSFVKLLPWEIAHFALWQIIFSTGDFLFFAEFLLVMTNILLVIYMGFPFFNRRARAIHDIAAQTKLVKK